MYLQNHQKILCSASGLDQQHPAHDKVCEVHVLRQHCEHHPTPRQCQ